MKKLQELWTRYKVQFSFIGGAFVVATAQGTCTYEPAEVTPEAPAVAPKSGVVRGVQRG